MLNRLHRHFSDLTCECRDEDGQWQEEEGQSTSEAKEQSGGDGEAHAAEDEEGEGQLPVNTLFYGVRGQQVHSLPHLSCCS